MKALILDIETSPNLAHVWGMWQQNVALNQLKTVGQVISFAWKWHDQRQIGFEADYNFETGRLDNHDGMLAKAHELMEEADAIVTWNGKSFDLPHLRREFLLAGHRPPAPSKDIDLMLTVKKRFRFTSNKLDHVAQQLGVGAKVQHSGFTLWKRCLEGDDAAWRLMRRYNRQDVAITAKVYDRLRPWVNHPHLGLYGDDPERNICGNCGSDRLQRRGYATTSVGRFARWQCQGCGAWSRSARRDGGVDIRPTQ